MKRYLKEFIVIFTLSAILLSIALIIALNGLVAVPPRDRSYHEDQCAQESPDAALFEVKLCGLLRWRLERGEVITQADVDALCEVAVTHGGLSGSFLRAQALEICLSMFSGDWFVGQRVASGRDLLDASALALHETQCRLEHSFEPSLLYVKECGLLRWRLERGEVITQADVDALCEYLATHDDRFDDVYSPAQYEDICLMLYSDDGIVEQSVATLAATATARAQR